LFNDKKQKKPADRDRYYAILVMDGDKMGELVSGKNVKATWASAMHPDIVNRMQQDNFDRNYRDPWRKLYDNRQGNRLKQRLLTSDIHAAISESLGDFALHGVSRIISQHKGRLIYAGGDDVCAVLPLSTALLAARQIRKYYRSGFMFINLDGTPEDINGAFTCRPGKLCLHLGQACSISAGILICHHKEPLSAMINQAEHLLKEYAKKQCDRDACAIELRKRSGGSRFFMAKWDQVNAFNLENIWDTFSGLWQDKAMQAEAIGKSLIYHFASPSLKDGFQAILDGPVEAFVTRATKLVRLQVRRSLVISEDQKERLDLVTNRLAGLIFQQTPEGKPASFKPERLIVSEYLQSGRAD
jgi:CRISPR-associated protein Cmr2